MINTGPGKKVKKSDLNASAGKVVFEFKKYNLDPMYSNS
jgi:hypothetical protein